MKRIWLALLISSSFSGMIQARATEEIEEEPEHFDEWVGCTGFSADDSEEKKKQKRK